MGASPVTTSFVHIRRASLLIFFMFFHSPQPSTRYVSMSVCQSAHTRPLFLFPPPLLPVASRQSVSSECVSVPLFSFPSSVGFVSCRTNADLPSLSNTCVNAGCSLKSGHLPLLCMAAAVYSLPLYFLHAAEVLSLAFCLFERGLSLLSLCLCPAKAQHRRRGPGSVRREDRRGER